VVSTIVYSPDTSVDRGGKNGPINYAKPGLSGLGPINYALATATDEPVNPDPDSLKFTIDTTRGTGNAESSDNVTYVHRFRENKSVNGVIEWGDGTSEAFDITSNPTVQTLTHVYPSGGEYQIRLPYEASYRFNFNFANTGDRRKLTSIDQWGRVRLNSMFYAFYGCFNMEMEATDEPTLASNTSYSNAFRNCTGMTKGLGNWNMDGCTSAFQLMRGCTNWNADISGWRFPNATSLSNILRQCSSLTSRIDQWTMPKCTNLSSVCYQAPLINFNFPMQWDTPNVTNFSSIGRSLGNEVTFDLSQCDFSKANNVTNMFLSTKLTTETYSNLLISLAAQTLVSGERFDAGTSQYNAAGETARNQVIANAGWTINDGGRDPAT